jgi:Ca2+-transporting ATPase
VVQIGIFSNRYMQLAVGMSMLLLLVAVNVPFLQPLFNTHFLSLAEWAIVVGLALIPSIVEEMAKAFLRWNKAVSSAPTGSSKPA